MTFNRLELQPLTTNPVDLDLAMTRREQNLVRLNLKRLRCERNISVKALSLGNVSHEDLLKMERGKIPIPVRLAFRLANRLGASRLKLFKPIKELTS